MRRSVSSAPSRWPISTIPRAWTLSAKPPSINKDFRVYALAALAAMDQPASHLKLRKLMDEPEIELRYGAFNALRTLDPHDPFLGLVRVIDEPKPDDDDDEPLRLDGGGHHQRVSPPQRRRDDPFGLYVVDSEGPRLIHISRTRRSEIVVFGRQQKLLPPIVLDTGSIFLNAAESDDKIELSKIVPSRYGDADVKMTTSLELAEVVRKTASLGATYPQIVAILENAKRQKKSGRRAGRRRRARFQSGLPRSRPGQRHDRQARRLGQANLGRDFQVRPALAVRNLRTRYRRPRPRTTPPTSQARMHPPSRFRSFVDRRPGEPARSEPTLPAKTRAVMLKKAMMSAAEPTAKKDDAVQKATAEDDPPPRRRLFDLFRRDDE